LQTILLSFGADQKQCWQVLAKGPNVSTINVLRPSKGFRPNRLPEELNVDEFGGQHNSLPFLPIFFYI
jgi:hypothetical protein